MDGTNVTRRNAPCGRGRFASAAFSFVFVLAALAAMTTAAQAQEGVHVVPLFPAASPESAGSSSGTMVERQGFVRVVNHSDVAGTVSIAAFNASGRRFGPATLSIEGGQTAAFNSDDIESGNALKGLSGGVGPGSGTWWLELRSTLDVEALAYVRTSDGFLTSMHDVAHPLSRGTAGVPGEAAFAYELPFFNPGSNTRQVSLLRLVNTGDVAVDVSVHGEDDSSRSSRRMVRLSLPPRAARELTSAQLETGGDSLSGAFDDGIGKWRLLVSADQPLAAMSVLSSPQGHLTNLSTRAWPRHGRHIVSYFPADGGDNQGFVRLINRSWNPGTVEMTAVDSTGRRYRTQTVSIGADAGGFGDANRNVLHFNSRDLEHGNADKGILGVGNGAGHWRLELRSASDIEALAYIRGSDGFLTAMHDGARRAGNRHAVPTFNPASNTSQVSSLVVTNIGERAADVVIEGVDDRGESGRSAVRVRLAAGASRILTAQQLESGNGVIGALGNGSGKWRLAVASEQPLLATGLLASRAGDVRRLTNLSTRPSLGPLRIADARLRRRIEQALDKPAGTFIMPHEMSYLDRLRLGGAGISDIAGLEFAVNVTSLNLRDNPVSDISPLWPLRRMVSLTLGNNDMRHVAPLAGARNLESLWIVNTRVSDLSALENLPHLRRLELHGNQISDLSPFARGLSGGHLNLSGNGIADLSPLSGRSNVEALDLSYNRIVDISPLGDVAFTLSANHHSVERLNLVANAVKDLAPLVGNDSLQPGNIVDLRGNALPPQAVDEQVAALTERGVQVLHSPTFDDDDEFPGSRLVRMHNDNVLVMHANYDAERPVSDRHFHPTKIYSREFYRWFEDAFDFLIMLWNFDTRSEGARIVGYGGSYTAVHHDTEGIGEPRLYDNRFQSPGRLRGIVFFPMNVGLFEGAALHELMHAWGNRLIDLQGGVGSHWGFTSANGVLGGFDRRDLSVLGNDRYAAGVFPTNGISYNTRRFSPLERYLGGFAGAEDVPDLWMAPNGAFVEGERTQDGQPIFQAAGVEERSIEHFIDQVGPRMPHWSEAQHDFRAAVILLVDAAHPATEEQLRRLSEQADWLSHQGETADRVRGQRAFNFHEATGGVGTLTLDGLSQFRKSTPGLPETPASFGRPPPLFLCEVQPDGSVAHRLVTP